MPGGVGGEAGVLRLPYPDYQNQVGDAWMFDTVVGRLDSYKGLERFTAACR
jgi:hypothetical protein